MCGLRLVGLLSMVQLCLACGAGQGMRMDSGDVIRRGQAAGGAKAGFGLMKITPEVIQAQQAELAKREKRLPDPLKYLGSGYNYRIAPYDVLTVTVWDHPELTIPAGEFRSADSGGNTVNADGTIFYPHAGVLEVAGKTVAEVREMLTHKMALVLQRPQLDVKVAAFRGRKVAVTGEIKTPATLPITDVPVRALDVINACQGPTAEADLAHVVLTRQGTAHTLNLQAANEEGDLTQNWLVTDGDVLYVPDRSRNQVYVMGEVKQQGLRTMVKGRMNLAEALANSDGLDNAASNASGIFVIRGEYQKPQVYLLDASSADALLLASNFPLRPRDIVFVSTHKLNQWGRIISQIAPTVNMVTQPFFYARVFFN